MTYQGDSVRSSERSYSDMSSFLVPDGDTSFDNFDDKVDQSKDNSITSESSVKKVIETV